MDQKKDLLSKYTILAKSFIYDAGRAKKLIDMMGTPQGVIIAVQSVLGAIEQGLQNQSKPPIPPELVNNLGVNIYLLLVDVAQEATGVKASPEVMKKVIGMILDGLAQSHGPQQQPPQQQPQQAVPPVQPQQPQGILQGAVQ